MAKRSGRGRFGHRTSPAKKPPVQRTGRPPLPYDDMRSMSLYVPTELHERLRLEAFRRDVSVNHLARRLLDSSLPEWEAEDV